MAQSQRYDEKKSIADLFKWSEEHGEKNNRTFNLIFLLIILSFSKRSIYYSKSLNNVDLNRFLQFLTKNVIFCECNLQQCNIYLLGRKIKMSKLNVNFKIKAIIACFFKKNVGNCEIKFTVMLWDNNRNVMLFRKYIAREEYERQGPLPITVM